MSDNQTQRELVQFADIAVRVASQLRLLKAGRPFTDPDSLHLGLEFVEKATNGGSFMSKKFAQFSGGSLRPLNWATDAYLETSGRKDQAQAEASQATDYSAIVRYLEDIASSLNSLINGQISGINLDLDAMILFFEVLGETLGVRADQQNRRVSAPFGFGQHAAL